MKTRWKILLNYTIWAVLIIALMASLSFVAEEQQQMRCKSLEVVIKPDTKDFFITRDDVVATVTEGKGENALKGQPVVDFRIGELEDKLELNPFIKDAEVFIDIEGNLRVEVWQRQPIVRIAKNNGTGFYIDDEGVKMPLSDNFAALVPVATGRINEPIRKVHDTISTPAAKNVYELCKYIKDKPF